MSYTDIHHIITDSARRFPHKPYIVSIDQQTELSFQQLDLYTGKIASYLKDIGVQQHHRVSIVGPNSLETVVIFLGILRYGATVNPIFHKESPEIIESHLLRVTPGVVFYDQSLPAPATLSGCRLVPFGRLMPHQPENNGLFYSDLHDIQPENVSVGQDEGAIAEIIFTSGTTNRPKGVAITREGLFYMIDEVIEKIDIGPSDRVLEYRAYSWASTQLLSLFTTLTTGATLFLANTFSRTRFSTWLQNYKITIASGVPAVINMLVHDPVELDGKHVPSLRFLTSSSAPLDSGTQQAFEERYTIPINQMAGMTETGWLSGNPIHDLRRGTVGTPFKYKEISIVNESGIVLPPGEEGEIVASGKSLALGYLNDDGGIDDFPAKKVHTGDIGYLDHDGFLFITGRKKEIIIRGGINISPLEITTCLLRHPQVKEAATIGVPDAIYGEEIAAFVVSSVSTVTILQNYCTEELSAHKVPRYIFLLEHLPRSAHGKVLTHSLLKLVNP